MFGQRRMTMQENIFLWSCRHTHLGSHGASITWLPTEARAGEGHEPAPGDGVRMIDVYNSSQARGVAKYCARDERKL